MIKGYLDTNEVLVDMGQFCLLYHISGLISFLAFGSKILGRSRLRLTIRRLKNMVMQTVMN